MAVDEVALVRQRLLVLRAKEERIGLLIAQHSARLAALRGDTHEVRVWCKLAGLDASIEEHARTDPPDDDKCVICGDELAPTGGRYRRQSCSKTCLYALRQRSALAAAASRRGDTP